MYIYAKISDGIVVNTIVIGSGDIAGLDPSFIWVDITNMTPQPYIGLAYNGSTFTFPAAFNLPLNQQYTPVSYGQLIINNFSSVNQSLGIPTSVVLPVIENIMGYVVLLQTGALATFLAGLPSIPIDGTVITIARVASLTTMVENYLNGD